MAVAAARPPAAQQVRPPPLRAPRLITGDCEHARTEPALITVADHTITGPITGRRRGPPARPWPSYAPAAGRCPELGPSSPSRRGSPRVARPSERVLQRRADGWRAPPLVQAAIGQRRGTKECRHWLQSFSSSSNSWSRQAVLTEQPERIPALRDARTCLRGALVTRARRLESHQVENPVRVETPETPETKRANIRRRQKRRKQLKQLLKDLFTPRNIPPELLTKILTYVGFDLAGETNCCQEQAP